MTPTCPHGQPQGECLICQALGMEPGAGGAGSSGGGRRSRAASRRDAPSVSPGPGSAGYPPVVGGPARQPGGYPPGVGGRAGGLPAGQPPRSLLHVAALVVVGLVVAGLAGWALIGVAFAILHVLELVVVAGAAGWVGYRVGHFRGRRGG